MTEELKKHPVIVIALEHYNPSDVFFSFYYSFYI